MRRNMKIWMIICLTLSAIYMFVGTAEPEMFPMVVVFIILAGMFFILAKSPKTNPYILGRSGGLKKSFFIILCVTIAFVSFGVLVDTNPNVDIKDKPNPQYSSTKAFEVATPSISPTTLPVAETRTNQVLYSVKQLLELNDHPRVFDSFSEAKNYYDTVGDNRVVFTGITEMALLEQQFKTIRSDSNILYFVQHSMNPDRIGTVKINIFDKQMAANMNVENAVSLIKTYLPTDFAKYYKKDAAYIEQLNGLTKYTYACRLNKAGVEYSYAEARHYPNYYYFRVFEYDDGDFWIIETGYAAYGDHDKGWIDKYTEQWNIVL